MRDLELGQFRWHPTPAQERHVPSEHGRPPSFLYMGRAACSGRGQWIKSRASPLLKTAYMDPPDAASELVFLARHRSDACIHSYMDSRRLCKILKAWQGSGLRPYIRLRCDARFRVEPSWKSARLLLVGLAARLRSRRMYQGLKALGLTDSPCRHFLRNSARDICYFEIGPIRAVDTSCKPFSGSGPPRPSGRFCLPAQRWPRSCGDAA
jgi:hypothetical protein